MGHRFGVAVGRGVAVGAGVAVGRGVAVAVGIAYTGQSGATVAGLLDTECSGAHATIRKTNGRHKMAFIF